MIDNINYSNKSKKDMEELKSDYEVGTRARTSLILESSPDRVELPGDNPFASATIINENHEYVRIQAFKNYRTHANKGTLGWSSSF